MPPPPLPPAIQTTILSHLLPPNIPLPQQLLAKSLLQRHLYLPPSSDDVDAWLNPAPVVGIADLLERLAGIGWRVSNVEYGHDGEHHLARVKIVEDGRGEGEGQEVDAVFEFEGGGSREGEERDEGRGWTYRSVYDGRSGNAMTNLTWSTDIATVVPPIDETSGSEVNEISLNEDQTDAPAGYWAGFSPPTSPLMDEDGNQLPQGEDDYWASYGKSFTPGGVTPAVQQSPAASRRQTMDLTAHPEEEEESNIKSSSRTPPQENGDGLLRSRMEMKIASLLRKLWISYLPSSDPELRALTFLSLARAVQSPSSDRLSIDNGSDDEGTRGKMEVLYEVYEVIQDGDQDGFMRLVEKSLTAPGGSMAGFGVANRQDSSAQLNYWE